MRLDFTLRGVWDAAILAGVAGIILAGAFASAARAADPKYGKTMKILFIGNSYTYVNDLPGLLTAMMAQKGIKLETKAVVPGGCTLERHWNGKDARAAIGEGGWDYVVIQEQSQMPAFRPPVTLKYAAMFAKEIRDVGAVPIFYMTWARGNKPEMQVPLTRTYAQAALDANALVAPAGLAWERALAENPKLVLHAKDHSHPTIEGTYLTACVFYATILRRDPTGLPGKIIVDKKIRPNVVQRRVFCDLKYAQVHPLQQVAWKVVQELKAYKPVTKETEKAANEAAANDGKVPSEMPTKSGDAKNAKDAKDAKNAKKG